MLRVLQSTIVVLWAVLAGCEGTLRSPKASGGSVFEKLNHLRAAQREQHTKAGEDTTPAAKYPKKLLFIGNSMTYVGNLPKLIAGMAKGHQVDAVTYDSETPGGVTLKQHFENGKAVKKIQSGHYDVVVIQGQSSEAIDDYENFKEYGIKLANEASKHGSKPVLFSAWSCCTPFACSGEQLEDDHESIRKAYEDIAKATQAIIAPVGKAWQLYRKSHPQPVGVLTSDNCHPNNDGAYLSACVFFETIFPGMSSVGTSFHGSVKSENLAKELQATAHSAVTINSKTESK